MLSKYLDSLREGGWITSAQFDTIDEWHKQKPFSLHWELRTILYLGISLLSAGLGVIIYNNIDTIGHSVIILLIGLACAGCYLYAFKNKLPYSNYKVKHASPFHDYVLLLGCLLFLAFEGYIQYQYSVFGTRYGIATLIPAILFLFLAYIFDHVGVLSLGITALASFAGITVSPGLILTNQFSETSLIYTGIVFAVLLIAASFYFKSRDVKKHFTFTYYNFGFNMLFLSLLAGCFTLSYSYIYFILLILSGILLLRYSIKEQSFYFLLMTVVYVYIAVTWFFFDADLYDVFGLYYFVFTCVGVIYFFINYKKILKLK